MCRPRAGRSMTSPSGYETQEVICSTANRRVVGPDDLPAELLKILADEGDPGTPGKVYEIIVAV